MTSQSVPEMLHDLAKLYEERNKVYGSNYKKFGAVMNALLEVTPPESRSQSTKEDINKLAIMFHIVDKLTRYMANWPQGHDDSLKDVAVYTQILRELHQEDGK